MTRTRIIVVLVCVAACAAVGLLVVPWLFSFWGPLEKRLSGPPPSDVKNPVTLDRPGFTLQYPGNWKIDAEDPDYDPDSSFTITSEGGSQISFIVHEGPRPTKEVLEIFVDVQKRIVMNEPERTDFERWGVYDGSGAELRGRLKGFLFGTIRVFVYSNERRSFTIVSMMYNEDRQTVEPGLALVESSFRLKL
jgi:hypothetical protein